MRHTVHAPAFECIAKGKAEQPFEFCVKTSFAVTYLSSVQV